MDYLELNMIKCVDKIDDLLNQLKNVVYSTKLNLHNGYHQINIAKHDVWKIAFKTK